MSPKVKIAIGTSTSILLVILSYYLILSNHAVISGLNEGNRLLYAFLSTSIMILLGTLIGITWDFIDKLFSAEGLGSKGK